MVGYDRRGEGSSLRKARVCEGSGGDILYHGKQLLFNT